MRRWPLEEIGQELGQPLDEPQDEGFEVDIWRRILRGAVDSPA